MSDVGRSYDRVAARYAIEISDELQARPLERALLDGFAEVADDGPLLDLGCGPGHVARYLRTSRPQVFALDLSEQMCRQAHAVGLPTAAGDLTALPVRSGVAAAVTCQFAVIHLDQGQRRSAYRELARVLRPGGHALIGFHTSDAEVPAGGQKQLSQWWGEQVELTFRYLEPATELTLLAEAGFGLVARLDRTPNEAGEHPSQRSYLLLRLRPVATSGPGGSR